MALYVGLDVSLRMTSICVVEENVPINHDRVQEAAYSMA
jgi:hypothetical protein